METNTEQIGIRTTKADKLRFEGIEGSTSAEKLQRLLDVYVDLKNVREGQIIDNTKELLDMLKVNLASLEKTIKPSEENLEEKLKLENEELKKELQMIKGKYHSLNREHGELILRLELKGIII